VTGWGADAVSVRFGSRLALDLVTVTAVPGQVTAVVGADGAGKTTLLRCLAGALAPSAGAVRRPPARRIGYLPSGTGVYVDLSVTENLTFRSVTYGIPASAARRHIGDYLERTGLDAAADRLAGQLSGGMLRKLGVVAAMLPEPKLLVLDEPTTGVDPVSRADLWWLIARAAAGGAAVLMSTTYTDEAARAARVLVLDSGRTLAEGTPAEIVAAIPGTIAVLPGPPATAEERRLAWRRAGAWRLWQPPPVSLPAAAPSAAALSAVSSPAAAPSAVSSPAAPLQAASSPADSASAPPSPAVSWPAAPSSAAPSAAVSSPAVSSPVGAGPPGRRSELVTPDLQDAVCVAALRRELDAAGPFGALGVGDA